MSTTAPQALKSLYIPAMTTLKPTEHYAGGIPIRAVENGLQIIVPAWYSMDLGHKVEVFCFGTVLSKTLEHASELNRDVVFTLAKGFVVDGDAADIYYKITIKNQVPEESKPRWTLLVKLTRPGEYDDIGGDDGHSDFNFTLDRYVVDDKFTPNDVVTMRIVTYRNLTKYDRIRCRWGSQEVVHDVTPEQAMDPLNHPIDIFFNYNLIKAAGDGSAVAVAFQVVDRCGNYPDERAPWSALQSVLVDMNGDRLDSPLVLVKGQPTDRVDLDTLGDDDVIVRVYTTAKDFAVNDEVLLTWTGTPAQGPQIIVGPLSKTVDFVPFQLDFIIPNEAVRAIAKGSASVGFVRRREGESDRTSKNASVSVVGDISQLLAPTVVEAPGGTLPVDTPWATVSAPWYVGRNGSDLLNVIWEAKAPGGDPVYYEDPRPVGNVAEGEPVLRNVSKTEIQRFDGLSVKVYYVVTNRDNLLLSVRESLPFIMQVGVAKPTFDRPEVVEADDNDVLDPDNVPPTGATLVLTHTGTQDKDRFNFNWKGSASGGSFSDHIDLIPVTAGKPVRVTVPKQYVTANRDGTVVADYKIERGGETLGYSQELKLRIGVALDLKEPKIKEAPNDTSLDPLDAQNTLTAVIDYDGMLVGDNIIVKWTGALGTLPGGSHTTDPWPVTTVGPQEIPLAVSVIAFNLDKSITLDYSVTRGTQEPKDSQIRTLAVLQLRVALSHSPKIIQAANGGDGTELDVSTLTTAATIRSGYWPHIANGQCVWMEVRGTNEDSTYYSREIWEGSSDAVNAQWMTQRYLDVELALVDLQGLKDLSELDLTFKATPDRSTDVSDAVSFPLRTYTVKVANKVRPTITSIKGLPSGIEIPGRNRYTLERSVKLSGYANKGSTVELVSGTFFGQAPVDETTGYWEITVTGLTQVIAFRVKDLLNGLISDSAYVRPIELSLSEDFGLNHHEIKPRGVPYHEFPSGQLTWVSGPGSVTVARYHLSAGSMKDSRLIIFDNSVVDYQFRSTYSSLSFIIFGITAVDCNLTTYDKSGKALETRVFRSGPIGSSYIRFSIPTIFRLRIEGVLSAQQVQLDNFEFTP